MEVRVGQLPFAGQSQVIYTVPRGLGLAAAGGGEAAIKRHRADSG